MECRNCITLANLLFYLMPFLIGNTRNQRGCGRYLYQCCCWSPQSKPWWLHHFGAAVQILCSICCCFREFFWLRMITLKVCLHHESLMFSGRYCLDIMLFLTLSYHLNFELYSFWFLIYEYLFPFMRMTYLQSHFSFEYIRTSLGKMLGSDFAILAS